MKAGQQHVFVAAKMQATTTVTRYLRRADWKKSCTVRSHPSAELCLVPCRTTDLEEPHVGDASPVTLSYIETMIRTYRKLDSR